MAVAYALAGLSPSFSESKKSQEQWESGTKVDPAFSIPLLMQNRVPDGYEDGEKVDVSLRPDSVRVTVCHPGQSVELQVRNA